jgi:hypothetical protein
VNKLPHNLNRKMLKTYLVRHLGRDKGATCTFPRAEFSVLSINNTTATVTCDNEYSFEIYDLAAEIRSKIPQGLKAEDCRVKIHNFRFEDIQGKKQVVDISCRNMDVVKNKEKERPIGKLPNLFEDEEVQEALQSGPEYTKTFGKRGSTPGKSSPGLKGKKTTPADTTAPSSRGGTQTPVKRQSWMVSSEDLTHNLKGGNGVHPSGKSTKVKGIEQSGRVSANQSMNKIATAAANASVPKGLKAIFNKSRQKGSYFRCEESRWQRNEA